MKRLAGFFVVIITFTFITFQVASAQPPLGVESQTLIIGLDQSTSLTFAPDGRMFITDVGSNSTTTTIADLNLGVAGANYGWPMCEDTCSTPGKTYPFFSSGPNGLDASIIAGFDVLAARSLSRQLRSGRGVQTGSSLRWFSSAWHKHAEFTAMRYAVTHNRASRQRRCQHGTSYFRFEDALTR